MNIQAVLSGQDTAKHEFGHMLGVGDKSDSTLFMYSDKNRSATAPTSRDFALALNDAISHHKGKLAEYRYFGPAPGVTAHSIVGYRPGVTATTLRAPYFTWE